MRQAASTAANPQRRPRVAARIPQEWRLFCPDTLMIPVERTLPGGSARRNVACRRARLRRPLAGGWTVFWADHWLRQGSAYGHPWLGLRGELRGSLERRGATGDQQAPIERLPRQVDIASTGNQSAACLHVEHLAPNVAGSEAAIGI